MCEATDWVSKAVEQRRIMRRARSYRKTRRQKSKPDMLANRKRLPPSTKARWDTKLRIVDQLSKILPTKTIVVEDIRAESRKNSKRWNQHFSPQEAGKRYFYDQLAERGFNVVLKQGYETKLLKDKYHLAKCSDKSRPVFESHCVDAWVLAASITGAEKPTTKSLYYSVPLRFHRRQLHGLQGNRKRYGVMYSSGLKRGTLVDHPKYSFCYVGGNLNKKLSLHYIRNGKRSTQEARKESCKVLTTTSFRAQFLPSPKSRVSLVL